MLTRLLVLADTHIKADALERLPDVVWDAAAEASAILHAGDVVCTELLDELGRHAPVHAVLGNNDVGRVDFLPDRCRLSFDGIRIAMVHDSGPRSGREGRMHRWFPDDDVVVFGHSHEPVDVVTTHGQRLFNPGSPTQRRRQPNCSFGTISVIDGEARTKIISL